MSSSKIELLSPAGTIEAVRAAVQNGADAVYLGGKRFSARRFAKNFDLEELKEVVKYAHLYGVKVYVAVNILVDNAEFADLLDYLYELYHMNVDAVIVQDLGVAAALRRIMPEMELHASTQMTVHNSAGARFLEEMGFNRVILAREVSLHNIRLISKKAKIQLEVFVHGALCVSYSGQCLMSSMIGGRSGNRGCCAQPCRLPYTLVNAAGDELAEGYLLSPRDLMMIEHLPRLADSGVVSLKVEGRMKRPEYVATVTRHYRNALDALAGREAACDRGTCNYRVEPEALKELAQIFNRDFTTGYFLEKPGAHLMSYQRPNNRGLYLGRVVAFDKETQEVTVALEEPLQVGDGYEIWVTRGGRLAGEIKSLKLDGHVVETARQGNVTFKAGKGRPGKGDRVFKTFDTRLVERSRATFLFANTAKKFPLDFMLRVREGEPAILAAREADGRTAEVAGKYLVEKADRHPLSRKTAQKQLERLGNTMFYLRDLQIEGDEGMMVPLSELNSLRRKAVEALEANRLARFAKVPLSREVYERRVRLFMENMPGKKEVPGKETVLSVLVGDRPSLKAALQGGARIIYFGGEKLRRKEGFEQEQLPSIVAECHEKGAEAVLLLPRIFHEEQSREVMAYCEKGKEAGVDGFLAGNPGAVQLAREMGLPGVRGDYTLNIFNDFTVRLFSEKGLEQLALSLELTLEQIKQIHPVPAVRLECLVHGKIPLMITEHCAIGLNLGKGHESRGCPRPCTGGIYGLKDRMRMVFPLESDENCRMLVYNPKTLSMIEQLPALLECGIQILRIEARREEAGWVKKVVSLYGEEIRRCRELGQKYRVREETLKTLSSLSPEGFTTGHYYRGVLQGGL
ncbi:MAG: DUF3656 domain-containing protein [Peptococcaceae bacterium]|nr:DUF3656 domain-containing protein [Peptococcaceae bacterium]MDH7523870.1 DUF3656 domain-containing protein [Peptococcaceae bacterium]